MRLTRAVLAVLLCAGLIVVHGPAPTASAARRPAAPSGVSVPAISSSSFTVAAARAAYATSYRLYVSRTRSHLQVAYLSKARAYSSTVPKITAKGLAYTSEPYYWRLATINGPYKRYSNIYSTSLRPPAPTGLAVRPDQGLSLTWNSLPATAFVIARSTDPGMLIDRVQYVVRRENNQFTPYGLTRGTRYYFRVKAANATTGSPWSAQVSAVAQHDSIDLRFMTYNILNLSADGSTPIDMTIPRWLPTRRDAAAALIRGVAPDVIALQEASQYTGSTWHSPWQVDTLVEALGSEWALAHTQGRWFEPDYRLTGSHIIYRSSVSSAVGNGGHWSLGDGKYAAFQLLRHRASGAEFVAISTHLTTTSGATSDSIRRSQTQVLVDRARAYSATHGGVPIIYGGDVGSVLMSWAPYDAPGVVMRSARTADAFNVAPSLTNARYSSVNKYRRAPVVDAGSVDRIFASPGVAVRAWGQAVNVSAGSYVGVLPSDHHPVFADVTVSDALG